MWALALLQKHFGRPKRRDWEYYIPDAEGDPMPWEEAKALALIRKAQDRAIVLDWNLDGDWTTYRYIDAHLVPGGWVAKYEERDICQDRLAKMGLPLNWDFDFEHLEMALSHQRRQYPVLDARLRSGQIAHGLGVAQQPGSRRQSSPVHWDFGDGDNADLAEYLAIPSTSPVQELHLGSYVVRFQRGFTLREQGPGLIFRNTADLIRKGWMTPQGELIPPYAHAVVCAVRELSPLELMYHAVKDRGIV